MSLTFSIAVYIICWWVVLFAVLPIGVRTQQEDGAVVPGTTESAPTSPQLKFKLLLTTVLASVVFIIIYFIMTYDLIRLDDIPFFPKYEAT
ncbi:MAG: DUF1467 family protein [Pseudomonadota bacterium]